MKLGDVQVHPGSGLLVLIVAKGPGPFFKTLVLDAAEAPVRKTGETVNLAVSWLEWFTEKLSP